MYVYLLVLPEGVLANVVYIMNLLQLPRLHSVFIGMDGSVRDEPDDTQCYECVDEEEEAPSATGKRDFSVFSDELSGRFDALCSMVRAARERRLEALAFKNIVEEGIGSLDAGHVNAADQDGSGEINLDDDSQLGRMLPGDMFAGDANMRTLDIFLRRVDARGYERSAQQLEFHEAFKKAAARVIYRADWEASKPVIMRQYGWTKVNSEVLISTPRRFGKTYSIAIYCACLAMALGVEIVVFRRSAHTSPLPFLRQVCSRNARLVCTVQPDARAASCWRESSSDPCAIRTVSFPALVTDLPDMHRFIGIAGGSAKICEYSYLQPL